MLSIQFNLITGVLQRFNTQAIQIKSMSIQSNNTRSIQFNAKAANGQSKAANGRSKAAPPLLSRYRAVETKTTQLKPLHPK
jgi:hypothetical protein